MWAQRLNTGRTSGRKRRKKEKKIKKKTKVKEKNSDLVLSDLSRRSSCDNKCSWRSGCRVPSHADEIEERTLNRALSSSSFRAGLATERARSGSRSSNSSLGSRRSSRSGSSWGDAPRTPLYRALNADGLPGVIEDVKSRALSNGHMHRPNHLLLHINSLPFAAPACVLHAPKDYPLRYWNVHVTASELFDYSLVRAWRLDTMCSSCTIGCLDRLNSMGADEGSVPLSSKKKYSQDMRDYGTQNLEERSVSQNAPSSTGIKDKIYEYWQRCGFSSDKSLSCDTKILYLVLSLSR